MNYDKKKKKLSALKVVFSHKKIAAANVMMLSAAIFFPNTTLIYRVFIIVLKILPLQCDRIHRLLLSELHVLSVRVCFQYVYRV